MRRAETTLAQRLGHRVRELREAAGLTLDEVCRRAGLDAGDLSRIETGRGPKSIGTDRIERLARALGAEPSTLLES